MESERGPPSPWLPVRGEALGLGFPPAPTGWEPVFCVEPSLLAACDRGKGETLCGADTEELPAELASRVLCFVWLRFLGTRCNGPIVALCYNGPLATFHRTSGVLSYPPVENGIEWP